jgi:hypothetical protein
MFQRKTHLYLLARLQLPTIVGPILPDIDEQIAFEFANSHASLAACVKLVAN